MKTVLNAVTSRNGVPINKYRTIYVLECDACLKVEQCPAFKELSKGEQEDLQLKYPCSSSEDYELSNLFGFAPISTGDYVNMPLITHNTSSPFTTNFVQTFYIPIIR